METGNKPKELTEAEMKELCAKLSEFAKQFHKVVEQIPLPLASKKA